MVERLFFRSQVSNDHGENKRDADETRTESDQEQQPPCTLDAAGQKSVEVRKRNVKIVAKIARDLVQVLEFASAVAKELPAPIKAQDQKHQRLQACGNGDQQFISADR